MELKLKARRPRWWEKKWKPKKPILYIIETVEGKWVNTYWWGGNWKYKGEVRFYNSGIARVNSIFRNDRVWLVVGKSGTVLTVDNIPMAVDRIKIKSLNPKDAEWTCFGKISRMRIFTEEVSPFNLEEKIKRA